MSAIANAQPKSQTYDSTRISSLQIVCARPGRDSHRLCVPNYKQLIGARCDERSCIGCGFVEQAPSVGVTPRASWESLFGPSPSRLWTISSEQRQFCSIKVP
ncbi:UNVERIFIED_CONTAM: hypothetical protein HHA_280375 [Hammondia hammondi]|eukprot:XP_008885970.1 hypothetical protein HHA_280375 [Hammondia hammondi]